MVHAMLSWEDEWSAVLAEVHGPFDQLPASSACQRTLVAAGDAPVST